MNDVETTTALPSEERESGRHPVNVGHLVMGVAFLGLVAVWALVVGDVVEDGDVRWLLPFPWVLAGAAGLLAMAVTGRRARDHRRVGSAADEAEGPEAAATTESTERTESTESTESTDTEEKP